jgi:hypothetical protein
VKRLMGGDGVECVWRRELVRSSTACGGWGKQYDDGWVPRGRTCAPHGTRLGRKRLRTCLARGESLQRGSRRCYSRPSALPCCHETAACASPDNVSIKSPSFLLIGLWAVKEFAAACRECETDQVPTLRHRRHASGASLSRSGKFRKIAAN